MIELIGRVIWILICWLELSILTVVIFVVSWLPRKLVQSFFHKLSRIWCGLFLKALRVKLSLHEKNIKAIPKQFILIANHPSALEDFAIPALYDVYPLAKQGVRDWFLLGRISYVAGAIFVKRDNPDSRHAAVDKMVEALEQGKNIALFPEGGCKGRRIFERFHYGAFDISLRTGIPILPLFLHYEAQDRFEWRQPYNVIQMFWRIFTSPNHQVNYYQYDVLQPEMFKDKSTYAEYAHGLYLEWQKKYLD